MNKNTLNLHLDILDSNRKELLKKIIPFTGEFVLGGGTALALQLAHRKSYDFDFFSTTEIPKKLLENLSTDLLIENVAVDTKDELTFFTSNSVKITFLYYPFKQYYEVNKAESGLSIFPVREIALQKAYTIGRRGEYRDYFDLYIILKKGYLNLKQLIPAAKEVYSGAFDEKIFLTQLIYFKDLTNFNIVPAGTEPLPDPKQVQQFLTQLAEKYI